MKHLSHSPIGKKSVLFSTDVAHMLMQLPIRAAFVHSGGNTGVIYTDQTAVPCSPNELNKRFYLIRGQTRQKYCQPMVAHAPPLNPETSADVPNLSRWEEVNGGN